MKNLRIILVALLAFSPMMAQADQITISGTADSDGVWEVVLVEGSLESLYAMLSSQEWWGDSDLAAIFAAAFGVGETGPNGGKLGAYFAYDVAKANETYYAMVRSMQTNGDNRNVGVHYLSNRVYAVVRKVPEPGTLALLGLGLAGMGLTRRRKQA